MSDIDSKKDEIATNNNEDIPEQNKPTTKNNITAPSKFKFPWFYFISSLAILIAVLLAYGKYYYSFKIVKPWHYKANFYSWRILYADKHMYSDMWKYIKDNKYPEKGEMADAVKKYQTSFLLFDLHPEHLPRGAKYYHTHHSDHKFNKLFLDLRHEFSKKRDEPMKDEEKSGKKEISAKNMKYWIGNDYEVDKIFEMEEFKDMNNYMFDFYNILDNIKNKKYGDGVGDDVNEKLLVDIEKFCQNIGVTADKDTIKKELIGLGRIDSDILIRFIYSRLFYLFYFYTIEAPIKICEIKSDDSEDDKKLKEKEKKNPNARIIEVSRCFTSLLANMFQYDYDVAETKDSGFYKFMIKIFKIQRAKVVDFDENIKTLMDEMKKKVEKHNTKAVESKQ